jgi:hypothetical protein
LADFGSGSTGCGQWPLKGVVDGSIGHSTELAEVLPSPRWPDNAFDILEEPNMFK